MLITGAAILSTLLSSTGFLPPSDGLGRLTVFREDGAPLIVVREQSSPPLLAIRLSVPYEEPGDLAGAGRVLQLLVEERVRGEVRRFGGRFDFRRTPTHLVYTVHGPARAFGDMVSVLRYAVAPPRSIFRAQKGVWLTARRESLAEYETPDRVVRHRLVGALFPERAGHNGGLTDSELPGPADLEWFWRSTFRPANFSVVVVGAITPDAVRAAFGGWTEPPPAGRRRPSSISPPPAPAAEVIATRVALGYPADGVDPAALAISTSLIDRSLRTLRLRTAESEFWWLGARRALVIIASAEIDRGGDPARLLADLQIAVSDAARATAEEVTRERRRLQHALLMRARTPGGLADLIGEFLERTGDPGSAQRFLSSLAGIDDEAVRSTIRTLIFQPPTMIVLEP